MRLEVTESDLESLKPVDLSRDCQQLVPQHELAEFSVGVESLADEMWAIVRYHQISSLAIYL